MKLLRRDFLKYCIGSAAALGLEFPTLGSLRKALAATASQPAPTYPILTTVNTTLIQTVNPFDSPPGSFPPLHQPPPPLYVPTIPPCDIAEYAANGYGEWNYVGGEGDVLGVPFVSPAMAQIPPEIGPSVTDPTKCATLLSFFTMSDVHICDKESPARSVYLGYQYPSPSVTVDGVQIPQGSSACYSGINLYTTHVLDAAVQTINALHQKAPLDFGIALGDASDNTQFNEVRWYIDVIDGKRITPSSGANLGAGTIDYQKPYQAAGLDKSIKWYQVLGNHDLYWQGAAPVNAYIRQTLIGSGVLNIGPITSMPPVIDFKSRGIYMGLVDGSTGDGTIINVGPVTNYKTPPRVAADPKRRSLPLGAWMAEFFNTTSQPPGHGFTQQMIQEGFACYHFYPKADVPVKVIVLDNIDRTGTACAKSSLDQKRYNWLIKELKAGQKADELMIICSHVPVAPYAQESTPEPWSLWNTNVTKPVTEQELIAQLHQYPNLVLWIAGHVHRNSITPQPSTDNPEYGFYMVETPSLRDFPQQFRRFQIVRNSDDNLSTFVLSVDHAAGPMADGSPSPALKSRQLAIGAQQIFANPAQQGPGMDPNSCAYNVELVTQLSQLSRELQAKIMNISPVVSSFEIIGNAGFAKSHVVTLNNTVVGSTPTQYRASESSNFSGGAWQPYSSGPSFTLSATAGVKTVYFQVMDGSGKESAAVSGKIRVGAAV